MIDQLIQAFIGLTGVIAVILVMQPNDSLGRWGGVVGMLGQPFWLFATFTSGAWGMCLASSCWTLVWMYAIWRAWIEPLLKGGGNVGNAK